MWANLPVFFPFGVNYSTLITQLTDQWCLINALTSRHISQSNAQGMPAGCWSVYLCCICSYTRQNLTLISKPFIASHHLCQTETSSLSKSKCSCSMTFWCSGNTDGHSSVTTTTKLVSWEQLEKNFPFPFHWYYEWFTSLVVCQTVFYCSKAPNTRLQTREMSLSL